MATIVQADSSSCCTLARALSIAGLIAAVALFAGLTRLDDSSAAALLQETRGLTRGSILDRTGHPIAETVNVGGQGRRRFSLSDLAALVGYRDPRGSWHGLEKRYDALLGASQPRHDWRTYFLHLRGEPARGGSVRLTLDHHLQQVADAALGNVRGAVVALDPRTGAVLAMVSKPDCTPEMLVTAQGYRTCAQDPQTPLRNRAISQLFVPGSSFKIVTLSAALDTRAFSLDSIFSGQDAFGPSPYFDNVTYPSNVTRADLTELTLAQALAFSDNFAFAHIGLTLGAQTLLRYAHRFGIGQTIPFVFPVRPSVIANGNQNPDRSVVAQSSFGAEVDRVTPLQMALIAGTIANDGVLMAPYLVQSAVSASGQVLSRFHPHPIRRVISERAARAVATAMTFVVDHGSGFNAQISGIKVAGKTGTAASGATLPHAWFIAFASVGHPVVAVAVLHEFSGEGFKYAAPIARKVLVAALQERGYRVH